MERPKWNPNMHWRRKGLTFWAPFDDPSNPLRLNRGTGTLSFTRATTATYVHPSTGLITSAASGQLRIEANGALIEGQRTNLVTYSEDYSNVAWGKTGATVSADNVVSPYGTVTADALIEDNTASVHGTNQGSIAVDNATVYTYSLFAKQGAGTRYIQVAGTSSVFTSNFTAWFDLQSGVIVSTGSGTTSVMSDFGGGWYRCSISRVTQAAGFTSLYAWASSSSSNNEYQGVTGRVSHYRFGTQLEVGAFPSSYIPTTTAAVTRNADVLSFTQVGNIGATIGTLIANLDYNSTSSTRPAIVGSNWIQFAVNSATKLYSYDGTTENQTGAIMTRGTNYKVGMTWGGSSIVFAKDGTSYSPFTFDGNLTFSGAGSYIGVNFVDGDYIYGHIKNLRIWNRALTDVQLQAVTT